MAKRGAKRKSIRDDMLIVARFLECDETLELDGDEADRIAARLRRMAAMPESFMAVVEKHAETVTLNLLFDLVQAVGLRLRIKVEEAPHGAQRP